MKFVANIAKSLFWAVAGLLFLFAASTAMSDDVSGVELHYVGIEYKKFFSGGRDPLVTQNGLPDRELGEELNLSVDLSILNYLYWNNTVHSMTDSYINGGVGQFRVVGWKYEVGTHLFSFLDVGLHHFSRHLLDYTYPYGNFPLQNAIVFRIKIFDKQKTESLF
jgi:hypothetical protein